MPLPNKLAAPLKLSLAPLALTAKITALKDLRGFKNLEGLILFLCLNMADYPFAENVQMRPTEPVNFPPERQGTNPL
ncbi:MULTISPECIES: hypothetical protein [Methylomicrobium]|uniref:hypothetical protein n=1 Tax=Methylomicrobium TaxID=39773 RepID=UPI0002FA794A|nr:MULTISPECIES: hypothetical protein [Methylomicrobium]